MFMAQVVSFATDQLGLRDQVQGLSLIQQAQRCLAELGSPLASTSSNGIVSGLPRISTRHVPKQVEAKPVYVGEVVDPELDALKRQLVLEKERNALLAERERLEKEKAQRMERAVEAQRRQQQQEEERMAMIERKKVRTTDKAPSASCVEGPWGWRLACMWATSGRRRRSRRGTHSPCVRERRAARAAASVVRLVPRVS